MPPASSTPCAGSCHKILCPSRMLIQQNFSKRSSDLDMSLLNTTVIVCLNLQLGTTTFVPIIVSPGFESTTAIEAQSLAPKNHTTNNHSVPNQCKQMLIERNLNLIRDRAGMGGSGTGWAGCRGLIDARCIVRIWGDLVAEIYVSDASTFQV